MRKGIVIAATVLALVLVNFAIAGKEQLLAEGRVVLLELAPVDPRSLMQGDYMALRFAVADDVLSALRTSDGSQPSAQDGRVVVALDARSVGEFRRIDSGAALAANEVPMRFRLRDGRLKFATNAFFFQEGHADLYADARYGEFRVDANGELLLAALRGAELQRLGP